MSDFDEFERQLNENKQGESAGGEGQRAGRLLASLRVPRHFPRRFPLFSGPSGAPPLPSRSARLAHVTARRAARGGEGVVGADPDACAPRSVPLPERFELEAAPARRARLVSPRGLHAFFNLERRLYR